MQGWDKKKLLLRRKGYFVENNGPIHSNICYGVLLLSMELCEDLERIICHYWWKIMIDKERGIHWLSWGRLSKMDLGISMILM